MEPSIYKARDITYMSELILDTNTTTRKRNLTCQGLIRRRFAITYVAQFIRSVSYLLI
jgi:hypothetical protein